MSANPKQVHFHKPESKAKAANDQSETTTLLEQRASKELVIGFMGAVGCGLPRVITECETQLQALGYKVIRIKLSAFINTQLDKGAVVIPPEHAEAAKSKYVRNQIGGNLLRNKVRHNVLAGYAINQIGRHRLAGDPESNEHATQLKRVAYLIDQIKHPEEVRLLRLVYRRLFYAVGVMSTHEHRICRLKDEGLSAEQTTEIIKRDRKESITHGQQLEKAFKLADYFVHHPLGRETIIPNQIARFLNLIHGSNSITPSRHEHAMYLAHSTSLRSACFSRQVGASILDKQGRVIAVGTNDVPQYGGGLYGDESSPNDDRCFKHRGICENDLQKRIRKQRIHDGVTNSLDKLFPKDEHRAAVADKVDELVDLVFEESGIPHLIEFSRAVHAEMDALISLSRGGGGSSVGGSLYTTTFPCHNCARHIIAAGIEKVYYIEPYEKSLAPDAHSDAIEVLDHDADDNQSSQKVKFIHFSGVAPKLYPDLFIREAGRKDADGKFIQFSPAGETPPDKIVKEYLDSYRSFEEKIAAIFDEEFDPAQQN
ncbi:MAG: anti-phage dCTP deaminase [Pseudomonadota bacterium]